MFSQPKPIPQNRLENVIQNWTVKDLLNKFSRTVMCEKTMATRTTGKAVIPCGEMPSHGREQSMNVFKCSELFRLEHGSLLSRMMVERLKEDIMMTKEMQAMSEYCARTRQKPKIVYETALNLEQGTGSVIVHLTLSPMLDSPR